MVVLVAATPAGAIDFNLSGGLDFAGSIDGDAFDYDSSTGFSLGLEVSWEFTIIELGAGLEYGFPRGTDVEDVEIDYTFLYGVGRLDIVGPFYLAARVGYSDVSANDVFSGDVDGGETWSAGFGIKFLKKFKAEAYVNNFSATIDGLDTDFDYQTYSARLLYTF